MAATHSVDAYARSQSPEHSRWYLDHHLITFLATSEDTNGQFGLIEYRGRKGGEPPPHTHDGEEECFYVLEGEMTFHIGDEVFNAPVGTWVVIPRGVRHSFTIESETVAVLTLFTPARFENYFKEMSEPAESVSMPPEPTDPPDVARLIAVSEKYGCTFS